MNNQLALGEPSNSVEAWSFKFLRGFSYLECGQVSCDDSRPLDNDEVNLNEIFQDILIIQVLQNFLKRLLDNHKSDASSPWSRHETRCLLKSRCLSPFIIASKCLARLGSCLTCIGADSQGRDDSTRWRQSKRCEVEMAR